MSRKEISGYRLGAYARERIGTLLLNLCGMAALSLFLLGTGYGSDGLCEHCGKNLNDGPCGCPKEIDPRMAVLEQLLDNKDE